MKLKTCKLCKEELPLTSFTSTRAFYCNNCRVVRKLTQQKEMQQRAFNRLTTKKQKKKVVKSIGSIHKNLQTKFNKWTRERDEDDPCISCRQVKDTYHAGHFIAQGNSGFLRYHEDNVHKQCVGCNVFKRGNLLEYRENLIKKIGQEKVDYLWNNRKKVYKWKRWELEALIEKYK